MQIVVTIAEVLEPITNLDGAAFMRAWTDIAKCHYALWTRGVRHWDPSISNLMVNKQRDGAYTGVLSDWDLDPVEGSGVPERTGTLPFMAQDLLRHVGDMERLYRHDLESLVWTLPWAILRYQSGKLVDNPPIAHWVTDRTCYDCGAHKVVFLDGLDTAFEGIETWSEEVAIAIYMLLDLDLASAARRDRLLKAIPDFRLRQRNPACWRRMSASLELSAQEVYEGFWETLRGLAEKYEELLYVIGLLPRDSIPSSLVVC
ncbi:hypothetical protein BV25DRAFT_1571665 [Artomyces pyxidatus]|uniref:Uncharacterized protein n=1 Tax=Artomyces pyxidatus TaxID=48021 RepID=A0ACB8SJE2_9AGAM|nr:hypothetical protein BV25DRAFT_1571665 [Artomyces pyxidatus]